MGGLVLRKFINPKHNLMDEKRIGTDDVNDERMIFQLFLHSITHTHTRRRRCCCKRTTKHTTTH